MTDIVFHPDQVNDSFFFFAFFFTFVCFLHNFETSHSFWTIKERGASIACILPKFPVPAIMIRL